MKKLIILLVWVMVLTVPVFARGLIDCETQIIDLLSQKIQVGDETFSVSTVYIVQIENYFKGRNEPLTQEQADDVISNISDIQATVKENGKTDIDMMSVEVKERIISCLKNAVKAVEPSATVTFDMNTGDFAVKDGEGYVIIESSDIIKVTGKVTNELKIVFGISICVAVGLVVCLFIAKKTKLL